MKFPFFGTTQKMTEVIVNKVNQIYFKMIGGGEVYVSYTSTWAIETAFMSNADVYSVLMKQATKTSRVPYYCKQIQDDEQYKNYKIEQKTFRGDMRSILRELKSQKKAFKNVYKPLPLERPNPLMGWSEFWQLSKIYYRGSGNLFWYVLKNEQGTPIAIYVLPSHLMQIKIKPNAFGLGLENPVLGYEMKYLNNNIPFLENEVIHMKMVNPDWTFQADQLLGMSPLKSAYMNVENQILANKHNNKMLLSSGAFGFIFAKGEQMDEDQALLFTERIKEMDKDKGRMARISGISQEIGFQRVALGNDELNPYTALQWDRKTICNVLDWPDELMNNDTTSWGSMEAKEARKMALLDNIFPDCLLMEEAFNKFFIGLFKDYKGYKFCFDVSEMAEMQEDITKLLEWADKAPLTQNEIRELIKYEPIVGPGMDDVWINKSKIRVEEAMMTDSFLANIPSNE